MDFELNEAQRIMKKTAHDLAEKEFRARAAEWDETEQPPLPNIRKLAELGFVGMIVPPEYGGGGMDAFDVVLVIEEIARVCASTAALLSISNSALVRSLLLYGTEELKQRYLPPLVRGEKFLAWSMSEPDAGSDVGSIKSSAMSDGDYYVINGNKCFCSGAAVADVFLVLVRFDGIGGTKGLGNIMIDKETPGFGIGRLEKKMGMRGLTMCELEMDDCRVPKGNVVTKQGQFGQLMRMMDIERGTSNAPICLGIAQGAYEEALNYSKQRIQFGRPICEFQGIQWMLADMAIKIEAARCLMYKVATNASKGMANILEGSIAKTFANEIAIEVTNTALQIFGGYGYSRELPVERMYRDVRAWALAGGTTQIQRNAIAAAILGRRFEQRRA